MVWPPLGAAPMNPQSELSQKLQRQRRRMGEAGSPLRDIGNELVRSSPEVDCKVRVKQRALRFEGAENRVVRSSPTAVCEAHGIYRGVLDKLRMAPTKRPTFASSLHHATVGEGVFPSPGVQAAEHVQVEAKISSICVPGAEQPCPQQHPQQQLEGAAALGDPRGEVVGTTQFDNPQKDTTVLAWQGAALAEGAECFAESPAGGLVQAGCALSGCSEAPDTAAGPPCGSQACNCRRTRENCHEQTSLPKERTGASADVNEHELKRLAGKSKNAQMNLGEREFMEFVVLDSHNGLPQGFVDMLKYSLEVHDDLVQQLSRKNARLQAKLRERRTGVAAPATAPMVSSALHFAESTLETTRLETTSSSEVTATMITTGMTATSRPTPEATTATGAGVVAASAAAALQTAAASSMSPAHMCKPGGTPGLCTPCVSHEWRVQWRAQLAERVQAAQEARVRLGAEVHEATMRARLEHTCRAARERIAATARRAQREEEEVRSQALVAQAERERVAARLEACLQERVAASVRVAELEEAVRLAESKCREGESVRRARGREAETLQAELKAHQVRAVQIEASQHRVSELQRELKSAYAVLGEAFNCTEPSV